MGPLRHKRLFFLVALNRNMHLTDAGLLSALKLSQSSSGWKRTTTTKITLSSCLSHQFNILLHPKVEHSRHFSFV